MKPPLFWRGACRESQTSSRQASAVSHSDCRQASPWGGLIRASFFCSAGAHICDSTGPTVNVVAVSRPTRLKLAPDVLEDRRQHRNCRSGSLPDRPSLSWIQARPVLPHSTTTHPCDWLKRWESRQPCPRLRVNPTASRPARDVAPAHSFLTPLHAPWLGICPDEMIPASHALGGRSSKVTE